MSEKYSAADFYDKMDHEGGWEYFIISYGVSEDEVPEEVWDAIEHFKHAYYALTSAVKGWELSEAEETSSGNN